MDIVKFQKAIMVGCKLRDNTTAIEYYTIECDKSGMKSRSVKTIIYKRFVWTDWMGIIFDKHKQDIYSCLRLELIQKHHNQRAATVDECIKKVIILNVIIASDLSHAIGMLLIDLIPQHYFDSL